MRRQEGLLRHAASKLIHVLFVHCLDERLSQAGGWVHNPYGTVARVSDERVDDCHATGENLDECDTRNMRVWGDDQMNKR